MRSSSFRQSSITSPLQSAGGLKTPTFNPKEDNAAEVYRRQAARIEELEKENKRLAKEAMEGEKRWKRAEEELEDLREADGDRPAASKGLQAADSVADEVKKLVCCLNCLHSR